jgi:zinc transport system substrate-binding protein
MKRAVYWICATLLLACVIGVGAWAVTHRQPLDTDRLKVTATFYPVAEFTRQIGGDKVSVTTLVKPGAEPHDYDLTPREVAAMYTSKLLVSNGAAFEPWLDTLQIDLAKHNVVTVQASKGISLLSGQEENAPPDPHVWMSPVLAIKQVENIKNALSAVDPSNADSYEANAQRYIAQLQALDAAFRAGLQQCESRDIVTAHRAFGYLAAEYTLNELSISGLSPDDEPSPRVLAGVADFVRDHHVRYIFFEALVSPKLALAIAQETGAQTLAFNPLEGLTAAQLRDGQDYISVQKANLQALRTALHCQ